MCLAAKLSLLREQDSNLRVINPRFTGSQLKVEWGVEPRWQQKKIVGIQQTAPLGITDTPGSFQHVLPYSNMLQNVVSV